VGSVCLEVGVPGFGFVCPAQVSSSFSQPGPGCLFHVSGAGKGLGGELFVVFPFVQQLVLYIALYSGQDTEVERATWDWDCIECTALGHSID
jgi:hypothetical protein